MNTGGECTVRRAVLLVTSCFRLSTCRFCHQTLFQQLANETPPSLTDPVHRKLSPESLIY